MNKRARHRGNPFLTVLIATCVGFWLASSSASAQSNDNSKPDKESEAFDLQPPSEQRPNAADTTDKKPHRMKARIQYNDHSKAGAIDAPDKGPSATSAGGVRNTPLVISGINTGRFPASGLDYDLYLRRYDDSIPPSYSGKNSPEDATWQSWTSRILAEIHSLLEHTVTVPGYADFVVTARPDGHCTAKLATLMGGPKFKEQALSVIDKMDRSTLLHYTVPTQDSPPTVSFKMGVGGFHPTGSEGHFWCGVESEIPTAAEQLKKRYSEYHL